MNNYIRFSGRPRKNDALFMYGAYQKLPFVYTYCPINTEVVHGPSCKKDIEINTTTCSEDNVPIHERRSGGGTVVLSEGMVVTIVVNKRDKKDSIQEIFSRVHKPMIKILEQSTGIKAEENGISDLAINGKKILGSSLYLPRNPFFYFYQSSLMINSDLSKISRYLKHPPREPNYRAGRNHDSFCTTLKNEGCELSAEIIADIFTNKLADMLLR